MYSEYKKNQDKSRSSCVNMELVSNNLPVMDTSLSPRVFHILCKQFDHLKKDPEGLLMEDGFLDFNAIVKLSPADVTEDYDYFVECAEYLAPVMHSVYQQLSHTTLELFKDRYNAHLQWTTSPEILQQCFLYTQEDPDIGTILSLLLSTSILERSLGDVFLLKGVQCPSMLKDLLVSEELKNILGLHVIKLLRILIGPPVSLNLRNVVWHGFPAPGELDPKYAYFMLLVIASIGRELKVNKHLQDDGCLPHRTFLQFNQYPTLFNGFLMNMRPSTIDSILNCSCFVLPSMVSLWKLAVEKWKSQKFGECVALLLPQLEHAMRRVFAAVNGCPQRVLTAENTALFTTFDVILSQYTEDGQENQLQYSIGDSLMTLLLDLMIYPEGPRVRDRLSHGEVNFDTFPEGLACHILVICLSIACQWLPANSPLHQIEAVAKMKELFTTYQSLYHPISLLKSELQTLSDALSQWITFPRPKNSDIGMVVGWEDWSLQMMADCDGHVSPSLSSITASMCQSDVRILEPFSMVAEWIEDRFSGFNPVTLYRFTDRSSHEVEEVLYGEVVVIGSLRRIAMESLAASSQIGESCRSKYRQWEERKLRSRQRNTYKRMMESVPTLAVGLRMVLLISVRLLLVLDQLQQVIPSHISLTKSCKTMLQYCENLRTNTSPERNRWEEAVSLTPNLLTHLQPLINCLSSHLDSS